MHAEVARVVDSLWQTGLTEEHLRKAILRGESERDSATAFAPPAAPGFYAWAETVTALREILCPEGWERDDTKNLSLVVSPCHEHALLVVATDQATGLDDSLLIPQPKRPRGEATVFAVEKAQLTLFDARTTRRLRTGPVIWFLLVHRVPGREEVRAEVALPKSIDEKGYVSAWHYRRNLGTISLGPDLDPMRNQDTSPSDINIEVRRKS